MPSDRNLLSLDASLAIPMRALRFEDPGLCRRTPVRPIWRCCSTVFSSSVLALWINQETQWFSGEPLETPRTRCSLLQSPLMTRLPCSPGSTLVLRLYQETVHDFILPFMPPCGPHLTPLATGSLERSLLVFSTLGGLTGDDLSRLFFTYTNPSPQPAPAILSQESVHTTLSITHHTRKQPSTGSRTTHGPQSPP
jgi:hypothetical protein